ncbi:glycoside hydrolase family 18 protein [Sodiomyces alcalophilus JCM 7366]|uniref:glycoside hydrolase family 18 protein n=1 Tax=Sodiomyces alcalophilus JCM 7366 TaxID=591952 RepID=UPI0039B64111
MPVYRLGTRVTPLKLRCFPRCSSVMRRYRVDPGGPVSKPCRQPTTGWMKVDMAKMNIKIDHGKSFPEVSGPPSSSPLLLSSRVQTAVFWGIQKQSLPPKDAVTIMAASRTSLVISLISLISLISHLLLNVPFAYGNLNAHGHRQVAQAEHYKHFARDGGTLDAPVNAKGLPPSPQTPLTMALTYSGQSDYTCGPSMPCDNKACCGVDGWCGYSSKHCGKGCQSNCDAKAECGELAETPGKTCPLNVCCSELGFCGTTTAFCQSGCQSNCEQPRPNAPHSNSQKRIIGYWDTRNMQKPCGTMSPSEIPVHLLTHLFVAYAYINSDFQITNMDGVDPSLYKDVGNVKSRNPNLKLVIALGGWSFSDPGPWQDIFPDLASTKANRAQFIENLIGFMSQYGYDGVDFDWEYPGAKDRGGRDGDGENYTLLLKDLREAITASGRDYIVTFTAPSSYWYLHHFDLKGMETYVDWINLMSYDLHGVWDSDNPIGNQIRSHTNLTEIDYTLDLFWRVGIDPSNVALGLGLYGRSFELASASCWKSDCPLKGPGAPGRCSNTPGILAYSEIMELLDITGARSYLDEAAAVRYVVFSGNNWVSLDDVTTFQKKIDYANNMGLGGLLIWAIDLDTSSLEGLRAISANAPGL